MSKLKAPSTYKEVEANEYTKELSFADTQKKYLPKYLGPKAAQAFLNLRGKKLQERTVFINYDAANAYGTPIREIEACYFILENGVRYLPQISSVSEDAKKMSEGAVREWQKTLGELSDLDDPNVTEHTDCCLPWEGLDRVESTS